MEKYIRSAEVEEILSSIPGCGYALSAVRELKPCEMTNEKNDVIPQFSDDRFKQWLDKQLYIMNKKIEKWKNHLDQKHGLYEWKTARMWIRCIKEAASYEVQNDEYNERIEKAISILGRALASEQVYAATYQSVVDALRGKEKS